MRPWTDFVGPMGSVRVLDKVAALAVLALAATIFVRVPLPPRRPATLVVAAEGLSWPVVAPSLARGDMPVLSRLVARGHGRLVLDEEDAGKSLWDTISFVRQPGIQRGSLPELPLWDVLARQGESSVLLSWPGRPGVVRVSPSGTVVRDPPIARGEDGGLDPSTAARLARDTAVITEAGNEFERVHPALLLVGLLGPHEPGADPRPALSRPLGAIYARRLDALLGRLVGAVDDDTRIFILGRGLGGPTGPGAEGILVACGPGVARGPFERAVRGRQIGSTILQVAGAALPVGAAAEPAWEVVEAAAARRRPVRWVELP